MSNNIEGKVVLITGASSFLSRRSSLRIAFALLGSLSTAPLIAADAAVARFCPRGEPGIRLLDVGDCGRRRRSGVLGIPAAPRRSPGLCHGRAAESKNGRLINLAVY